MSNCNCVHEQQIVEHGQKIAELETRSDYKEKRLDERDKKIEAMDKKIDKLDNKLNQLLLQSKTDDSELELEIKAIKTRLNTQDEMIKDNREKFSQYLAVVTVVFLVLTFYFNFFR